MSEKNLEEALGPPGVAGDARAIVFLARQVGAVYGDMIDWSQEIRRTYTDDRWKPHLEALSKWSAPSVEEIAGFAPRLLGEIARQEREGTPSTTVHLSMTFAAPPDTDDASKAFLDEVRRWYREQGLDLDG